MEFYRRIQLCDSLIEWLERIEELLITQHGLLGKLFLFSQAV